MTLKPLVSIIGTTGVGKSRLGIELALALSSHHNEHEWRGGKVINADSMQVYAGADVITNKVPKSQQKGVEHVLMGCKDPGEQYVVGQWVNDAVREIDKSHQHNTVPIAVGGTSYWMQHLIFPNRLTSFEDSQETEESEKRALPHTSPALQEKISSLPDSLLELFLNLPEKPNPGQAFALHSLLTKLDPRMASRWHWNDTRKILRNLEIIKERGVPASEIMDQQSQLVEAPRYRTLIIWLYSNPELLRPRLDARVDDMIREGLLDDVKMLRRITSDGVASPTGPVDMTCGIFQSIGFKEFDSYLSTNTPTQALFESCLDRTKISTRQYARRQLQWIQNKLLPAVNISNNSGLKTPVYLLNVSDLANWDLDVRGPAINLVNGFLAERELQDPRTLSETAKVLLEVQEKLKDPTAVLAARRKIVCEICTGDRRQQPLMVEEGPEWRAHIRSRKHRRHERDRVRKSDPESRVEKRRNDHTFSETLDFLDGPNLDLLDV